MIKKPFSETNPYISAAPCRKCSWSWRGDLGENQGCAGFREPQGIKKLNWRKKNKLEKQVAVNFHQLTVPLKTATVA